MKKVFCVVLAVLMLFTMQIPAMAHGENIWENQADFAENSALVKAEDLMGFSFDRTSVTAESVRLAGCEYTEMTDQNDVKITVDQSGNLVRFNSIYAKKTENNMPVREKKNAAVVKENIADLFSIDQTYEVTSLENYGEYGGYSYIKEYQNGLQNPFESVKVTYNTHTGDVVIATKFDHAPNSTMAQIDENEAITAAAQSEYYAAESTVSSCVLTFILPSMFSNEKVARYGSGDQAILCYKIVYDGGYIIYVDAMDAEPIAVDEIMAYNSASFTIKEVSATTNPNAYNRRPSTPQMCSELNAYRVENIELSESGFARLGYTTVDQDNPYEDATINEDVATFLDGDSSYGFYFCGHANSNVLAFKYNTILRRTNVSGNWRFVFLDGCETAVDTGWAEQFNIYGRSGRAYLGWFDTVQLVYTHQFQDYFWPRVGNKAIQALALDAANSVPGQGTTPIRFWGDTSYTGVVG